jgi:glycogenin glucosyltransferase
LYNNIYQDKSKFKGFDKMSKNAYVTFIIRNDSFLSGALIFAYALKLQQTKNDLVCIVSENVSAYAMRSLRLIYDVVIEIPEVYVPHERRHERQDRPFLFSRFNSFRLGKDGDLGKEYDKIVVADCDILPLYNYDSLFDLEAPAGILNEKKENCMEFVDGKYIIPESTYLNGTWNWHEIYKDIPHGTKIPKVITDRIKTDKLNLGVHSSLCLYKPSIDFFDSIMDDLEDKDIQAEISTYNWPEMQYMSNKLSGSWTNIDLRYSSFNGYPELEYLYGTHFAGLKPWSIKNKSVKSFGKFEDYKLWYHTFIKMCDEYPLLLDNKRLAKIYRFVKELQKDEKYKFYKTYIPHLSHFFE